MKTTKDELIIQTAYAIEDCIERDGEDVIGVDEAGIRAALVAMVHRLHSGQTGIEDAVIQKFKDRAATEKTPTISEINLRDNEWIIRAQNEALDIAFFLEKVLQDRR